MARIRVLTLFVRHGVEKYIDALDSLGEYYASCLPDAESRLVVIDTAQGETKYTGRINDSDVIGGDNSFWEFSGWDSGLRWVGSDALQYDYVHLVTSAYRQLYTRYIERMDLEALQHLRGRHVALGHIDAYNRPIHILGRTSQAWIRSSFIFMPPSLARRIGSFVSFRDPLLWFSGDPASPFKEGAPLDSEYRDNIISWLTREGTGQGTEWHSRFDLNESSMGYFQNKALAILNEHALTIRLRSSGATILDPTWLKKSLRLSTLSESGTFRDWRAQIVEREPDL